MVAFSTRTFKHFLKQHLLGHLHIASGNREAIATLISYITGAIGYVLVIHMSGIDLSTFAVIAGGLGVGIGFGLQDITKNLVSGLTLLMERKLKVGDYVVLGEVSGYIEEISIRAAVIRTLGGEQAIIPNSSLVNSCVLNKSYQDFRGRIEVPVGVQYESDPVRVTETLLHAAYLEPRVLKNPSPEVIFLGFGDSALNFELWVWVNEIDQETPIKSALNFLVEYQLRQAGIQVPFPQRELWLRNSTKRSSVEELDDPQVNRPLSTQSLSLTTLLKKIDYFQSLNPIQMRQLIELGYCQNLADGEVWIQQGAAAENFCLVLRGAITALYEHQQSEEHLFTFVEGQFFGELPLILKVPYPTTMRAKTETILFVIHKHYFGELLQHFSRLEEDVIEALAQRKEILQAHREQLKELNQNSQDLDKSNIITWIHQQLEQLFSSSSSPQ